MGRLVALAAGVPPDALARLGAEHAGLRVHCSRLKEALTAPREARAALGAALDALLPALFQHEAAETAHLPGLLRGRLGGEALLARVANDHLTLRSLARDLRLVQENPQLYSVDHLARLAKTLHETLVAHLDFEDERVY